MYTCATSSSLTDLFPCLAPQKVHYQSGFMQPTQHTRKDLVGQKVQGHSGILSQVASQRHDLLDSQGFDIKMVQMMLSNSQRMEVCFELNRTKLRKKKKWTERKTSCMTGSHYRMISSDFEDKTQQQRKKKKSVYWEWKIRIRDLQSDINQVYSALNKECESPYFTLVLLDATVLRFFFFFSVSYIYISIINLCVVLFCLEEEDKKCDDYNVDFSELLSQQFFRRRRMPHRTTGYTLSHKKKKKNCGPALVLIVNPTLLRTVKSSLAISPSGHAALSSLFSRTDNELSYEPITSLDVHIPRPLPPKKNKQKNSTYFNYSLSPLFRKVKLSIKTHTSQLKLFSQQLAHQDRPLLWSSPRGGYRIKTASLGESKIQFDLILCSLCFLFFFVQSIDSLYGMHFLLPFPYVINMYSFLVLFCIWDIRDDLIVVNLESKTKPSLCLGGLSDTRVDCQDPPVRVESLVAETVVGTNMATLYNYFQTNIHLRPRLLSNNVDTEKQSLVSHYLAQNVLGGGPACQLTYYHGCAAGVSLALFCVHSLQSQPCYSHLNQPKSPKSTQQVYHVQCCHFSSKKPLILLQGDFASACNTVRTFFQDQMANRHVAIMSHPATEWIQFSSLMVHKPCSLEKMKELHPLASPTTSWKAQLNLSIFQVKNFGEEREILSTEYLGKELKVSQEKIRLKLDAFITSAELSLDNWLFCRNIQCLVEIHGLLMNQLLFEAEPLSLCDNLPSITYICAHKSPQDQSELPRHFLQIRKGRKCLFKKKKKKAFCFISFFYFFFWRRKKIRNKSLIQQLNLMLSTFFFFDEIGKYHFHLKKSSQILINRLTPTLHIHMLDHFPDKITSPTCPNCQSHEFWTFPSLALHLEIVEMFVILCWYPSHLQTPILHAIIIQKINFEYRQCEERLTLVFELGGTSGEDNGSQAIIANFGAMKEFGLCSTATYVMAACGSCWKKMDGDYERSIIIRSKVSATILVNPPGCTIKSPPIPFRPSHTSSKFLLVGDHIAGTQVPLNPPNCPMMIFDSCSFLVEVPRRPPQLVAVGRVHSGRCSSVNNIFRLFRAYHLNTAAVNRFLFQHDFPSRDPLNLIFLDPHGGNLIIEKVKKRSDMFARLLPFNFPPLPRRSFSKQNPIPAHTLLLSPCLLYFQLSTDSVSFGTGCHEMTAHRCDSPLEIIWRIGSVHAPPFILMHTSVYIIYNIMFIGGNLRKFMAHYMRHAEAGKRRNQNLEHLLPFFTSFPQRKVYHQTPLFGDQSSFIYLLMGCMHSSHSTIPPNITLCVCGQSIWTVKTLPNPQYLRSTASSRLPACFNLPFLFLRPGNFSYTELTLQPLFTIISSIGPFLLSATPHKIDTYPKGIYNRPSDTSTYNKSIKFWSPVTQSNSSFLNRPTVQSNMVGLAHADLKLLKLSNRSRNLDPDQSSRTSNDMFIFYYSALPLFF
ncbi:hypothetical protein VP01_71g4 [Puccinia sorghi]|uniref:Uncharacterized protein n=1 Tax=Puccinia sorghi TaxID=27349 RepID=A0A0L6UDC2_9BASI|nr:hypothetical protein VP01_71g4 [Puccinia sorghi]